MLPLWQGPAAPSKGYSWKYPSLPGVGSSTIRSSRAVWQGDSRVAASKGVLFRRPVPLGAATKPCMGWLWNLAGSEQIMNLKLITKHTNASFKHIHTVQATVWCRRLFIMDNFYPRPVLAFGYCHRLRLWVCVSVCVCVCVCSNHELVRTITHRPFKLGSPNLDQRCKTPWFGSLLFLGMIDLDLQGQI